MIQTRIEAVIGAALFSLRQEVVCTNGGGTSSDVLRVVWPEYGL